MNWIQWLRIRHRDGLLLTAQCTFRLHRGRSSLTKLSNFQFLGEDTVIKDEHFDSFGDMAMNENATRKC
jgi:hypothetical protein